MQQGWLKLEPIIDSLENTHWHSVTLALDNAQFIQEAQSPKTAQPTLSSSVINEISVTKGLPCQH